MRCKTIVLPTRTISDWTTFHTMCKSLFGFPDFYGSNMDAWIDCMSYLRSESHMTSIELADDEILLIVIPDAEAFAKKLPEIARGLEDCIAFVNQRCMGINEAPSIAIVPA